MKKILSVVMALILLWGLTIPAAAAETATGTTLRLEKTEGTVTVKNASGKSLTLKNGMRLYSGSKIKTDKESYAYISLDNGKAVKLGASSEGEVRKSGKKLELKVLSGELFFDVSVPLENDESLNIRTSTMVTGVRGTVGYVVVRDRYHSEVCLLEGRLTVTGTDEVSGGITTTEITAGQKATTVMQQTTQGEQVKLTVEPLKEQEVPGFVAVAVAEDTTLQKRIETKSTLNVQAIIQDAEERLETEQKEAAKEAEEVQRQVEEQAKETQQDQPAQIFASTSEPSSGSSYSPPAEIQLSGNIMPDQLSAALNGDSPTVVMSSGAKLDIFGEMVIPVGKTLKLDGATMNIGYASEVSGLQDAGEAEPANDDGIGAGAQFVVASGGRLELTNGAALNVNDGSGLDVAGILDLNSGAQMNIIKGGDRFGAMEVTGTVNVNAGAALQNGGSIAILSKNSIHVRGEMVNNGEIQIGGRDSQGLLAVEDGGSMTNSGPIEITEGSSLTNAGTFTMSDGEITAFGMAIENTGTITMSGGTISSTSGTAIINSGMATISGGTVSGGVCAIDNTKSTAERLTISWDDKEKPSTVVKVTASAGGSTSDNQVIKGSFTWAGGCLMAKAKAYFPTYSGGLPEITPPGNGEMYYTAVFSGVTRNLAADDISSLQRALYTSGVTTVNLDLGKATVDLTSDVAVGPAQTLNIKNGTLNINSSVMLTVNGSVNIESTGSIQNNGTVTVQGALAGIHCEGSFINGTARVQGGVAAIADSVAELNIGTAKDPTGSFRVVGESDGSRGSFTNYGQVNNYKLFTVEAAAAFSNAEVFNNHTNAEFDNQANNDDVNQGSCVSSGAFTNDGKVTIHVTFSNSGFFSNGGTVTVNKDGTFENASTFTNEETLINNGTFDNQGYFTNSGIVDGIGTFKNNTKVVNTLADYGGNPPPVINSGTFTCGIFKNDSQFVETPPAETESTDDEAQPTPTPEPPAETTPPTTDTATDALPSVTNSGEFTCTVSFSSSKGSPPFVNSGTFNNGGAFDNSGTFKNISGSETTATFNNGSANNTTATFSNAGTFDNRGTFHNYGNLDNSSGTFNNGSETDPAGTFNQYSGVITFGNAFNEFNEFYNHGVFTDKRTDYLRALTQDTSTNAVISLAKISNNTQGLVMSGGTTVKLFGNGGKYNIPVSISAPDPDTDGSIILNLNGQTICPQEGNQDSCLTVPNRASLTVMSSNNTGVITSNKEATIKVEAGGNLSYDKETVTVVGNIIFKSLAEAQTALADKSVDTVVLDLTEETELQTIAELVIPENKILQIRGGSVSIQIGDALKINGIIQFFSGTLTEAHTTISGNGDSLKIESTTTVETLTIGSTVTINENGVKVTTN